ncbi:universal stress protein [Noviherbaspirillum saxi]|uniref:Universal stress protein n=1 Tax=Noviherbaspirillum saxi TaxID=2320863 RepID=A0A3A3FV88_9BURK|nr:universal stress protein [Noviherbaspirillum saxi]RJG00103.1 universal stress protein [Noviherbaspirillum saxi]
MSYKTILVHVDESIRAGERIKLAAAVAMTEKAHLIGTAMTGASRYLVQARMLTELDPNLRTHLDFLRQRARRGLEDFDVTARKLGLDSFEKRLVDDEAGAGICLQARYADLVVIGQNDPNEISPVVMPDFAQYVVLNCARPVLLVPHTGRFDNIGNQVLIAWDASMEAARAVTSALPLLQRAQQVDVVIFNARASGSPGMPPGTEIVHYLRRHEIRAELLQRRADGPVGEAVCALASDTGADLIIMGGYGHARFRELVLGEVTRTLLASATIPVLMSH